MSDHTEAGLQALLDTSGTGRGVRIVRKANADTDAVTVSYHVNGGVPYPGKARWVNVLSADTDAEANTKVLAALA